MSFIISQRYLYHYIIFPVGRSSILLAHYQNVSKPKVWRWTRLNKSLIYRGKGEGDTKCWARPLPSGILYSRPSVSLLMRIAGVPSWPKIFRAIKPICIFGSGGVADSSSRRDKSPFTLCASFFFSPRMQNYTVIARINCNINFFYALSYVNDDGTMAMKHYLFIYLFILQNDRNICLKWIDKFVRDVISRILICRIKLFVKLFIRY